MTSGVHHWRPYETCSIEVLTPPLPLTVPNRAIRILLECCLVYRMQSPLQQLTFTSNKDQDRRISVDVSEDANGAKQVLINV